MESKQLPKQMELFEDGGLKDEGGMIDEVSGNDVPTGSTREEVRDDIPAQLSEGEFVLPADVVRYHGLEKIMALRDEAKQGLQKMEAMGQMGNSEEATLPDDVPFDMDDLDMEDEEEPQEMEMAEGGYVMVAGKPMPVPVVGGKPLNMQVGGFTSPTGTYQVPTNIATQPSYFQNYQQSTAPFQPFVPPQQQVKQPVVGLQQPQQQTYPSFATLMPTVGGKRETIEYRNEAGQKLFIPFVDGKPIYPIPEGYTKYKEEEEKPIVEDKSVIPTTTQVRTDENDSGVLSTTTQVRGIDNSLIDTNFSKQSPEKIKESFGKMKEEQRGLAVLNAIDSAKGSSTFARNLASGMLGVAGGPLGMVAGAYDAGSRMMGGQGLGLGQPQTDAFNNIISTFEQQYEGMSSEERDQDQYSNLDSLSQAVYGLNYEDATAKLGVAPTFKKGFKPGEIDPRTGGTYDKYGQSTTDEGGVSYSSFADAGRSFSAMAASGFMGGAKDAERVANKTTASAKDRARAQAYLDALAKEEKTTGLIADKKAKEEEAKKQQALAEKVKQEKLIEAQRKAAAEAKRQRLIEAQRKMAREAEQRRAESQGRVTGRETGMSMGDDGGGDSPSQDSEMGGMGDVGYSTAVGGFIPKLKKKTKKMKRGGLASKK